MTDKPNQAIRLPETASYEVRVFTAGKWLTELVLTDRDEAEAEAERILSSGRRPFGVCVVREEVNAQTGLITAATIYRRTREDEHRAAEREEKLQQTKAKIAEIRADRRQERVRSTRQETVPAASAGALERSQHPSKHLHWLWFLVLLAGLLGGGLLALLKLHAVLFS
ncbi:MAG: hypothetical protein QOJ54_584 [Aliidongia sp.]|jgi:hypothetical protein|nr:hypothetical protein [Aliidongia sp.]